MRVSSYRTCGAHLAQATPNRRESEEWCFCFAYISCVADRDSRLTVELTRTHSFSSCAASSCCADKPSFLSNATSVLRSLAVSLLVARSIAETCSRRMKIRYSSRRELDLREHLEQLRVLYEQLERPDPGGSEGGVGVLLGGLLGGPDLAQKMYESSLEGFGRFVWRVVGEKKRLIESELACRRTYLSDQYRTWAYPVQVLPLSTSTSIGTVVPSDLSLLTVSSVPSIIDFLSQAFTSTPLVTRSGPVTSITSFTSMGDPALGRIRSLC